MNAKKQLGIEVPQETLTRHICLTGQLMQAADQLEGRLADPMRECCEAQAGVHIPICNLWRTLRIGWSSW